MQINTISDFRKAMRNGPYAWPGGYPLYFIMADGEALSFKSAKAERRYILEALRDGNEQRWFVDWRVVAVDVNWENPDLICAHSGDRIESAYAED